MQLNNIHFKITSVDLSEELLDLHIGITVALVYVIIDSLRGTSVTVSKNDLVNFLHRNNRSINRSLQILIKKGLTTPEEIATHIKPDRFLVVDL